MVYILGNVSVSLLTEAEQKRIHATLMEMKKLGSQDPEYWISQFCRTFNPKVTPSDIPFKLFPFQKRLVRDLVHAIRNGEDVFIDKTREMGVSYTILATLLWFWFYEPGSNFLIGSRKEDYVDNRRGGTTGNKEESLFGKIDYMLSRLPGFILPEGFNANRHFNYMSLVNPANGNVISGESSNENFSRGGRHKAVFLDEFAFWDNSNAVWGATADTTNCRIIATTPGIKPSKAKRLRFQKDGERIKVITLNYNLDPRKNKKWLDEQRERRSTEDFGREIMVNWETSITGRVYPEIESAAYGDFPFLVNQPLYTSWDFGLDGVAIQWWQQNPANGKWRVIDSFEAVDKPIEWFFPLFGKPIDSKFQYTDDERKAIVQISQYPRSIHFGDPDVKKRSLLTGTSTRQELEKVKVYVQSISKNDFYIRREKTKVYLQKGIEINDNPRTEYFYESIKTARYPQREETSQATTPIAMPIHDWCLAGETKIRTLNGWVSIKDLVGKKFWIWTYSHKRKRMIPKEVEKCWMTSSSAKTMVVGLDDGHEIRCTPNHPFLLRNGEYKEAQYLKEGDSLMPFYEKNDGGYVDILFPDGTHGPEHRIVYEEVFGIKDQDSHIDHKNNIKWNNSPENLQEFTGQEHTSKTFKGISNGDRSWEVPQYQPYSHRGLIYKKCRGCGEEFLTDHKHFFCKESCKKILTNQKLRDRARNDEEYRSLMKIVNKNYEKRHAKHCIDCGVLITRKSIRCGTCNARATYDRSHLNHKVRFIKKDWEIIPVYDMEVPDTHNFVAEGVFTHNTSHHRTAMEYFFINIDTYQDNSNSEPDWVSNAKGWLTSRSRLQGRRR